MNDLVIGRFAKSKAGHDSGKCYVIFYIDSEYVYLVDGKIRTVDRPKKKKIKHIEPIEYSDPILAAKVIEKTAKNEEVKKAIKLLPIVNSSKEVL